MIAPENNMSEGQPWNKYASDRGKLGTRDKV